MAKTRFRFSTKFNDKPLRELAKTLRSLKDGQSYVRIGVLGEKAAQEHSTADIGRTTNGLLALVHEFGSPSRGIPARPWIRPAFEKNRAKYIAQLKTLLGGVYTGKMTIARALGILGSVGAADVRDYVTGGAPIPPPNAPATLRRKLLLGDNPRTLVDTGRMLNSVTYEVHLSGGVEEKSKGFATRMKEAGKVREKASKAQTKATAKSIRAGARDARRAAKAAKKEATRTARRGVKDATRAARMARKAAARSARQATKVTSRLAKKGLRQTTRVSKKTLRGTTRLSKKALRTTTRLGKRTVRVGKRTSKKTFRAIRKTFRPKGRRR